MNSVNLPLTLLHVLLLVTPSSLAFFPDILPRSAPGGRGAFTTSRLSLPPRTRPVERRDSSNTSTTNSTSNSTDFLWLIQDTYDHTNFFKCVCYCLLCYAFWFAHVRCSTTHWVYSEFGFYSGDDPTQYVAFHD